MGGYRTGMMDEICLCSEPEPLSRSEQQDALAVMLFYGGAFIVFRSYVQAMHGLCESERPIPLVCVNTRIIVTPISLPSPASVV